MKILVTGGTGQLGLELIKLLPDAICTGSKDLDITNQDAVRKFVIQNDIDTVINCAAYTAVDAAENDYATAKQVNFVGAKNLANWAQNLIHISTDYVFDGAANRPYRETDTVHPLGVYGTTKLMGERAVLANARNAIIIRTSWLYSLNGKNFLKTMQRLGAEKKSIGVVADQFGTPTYAADLAVAITKIIPQMKPENAGIYHFSNEGQCSWYDFASEIMKQSGLQCRVEPITTSQYPTPARRPQYSVLDKTKIKNTFGLEISDWKNALARCINSKTK
ncbi:MAG: dTDP-4-dehydrorhamnose reductase [Alphaproteobacteria bacterium]|nr:dTDP-4-dehydrorhamnose reductase [Alphaproteobacteria bacterium]